VGGGQKNKKKKKNKKNKKYAMDAGNARHSMNLRALPERTRALASPFDGAWRGDICLVSLGMPQVSV